MINLKTMSWLELGDLLNKCLWHRGLNVVSPIVNEDRSLYHRFFHNDEHESCYGNSWAYITQACRGLGLGLGLKYHEENLLLSVGYYQGHYVVVRPMGNITERMVNVLEALRMSSGKPVFIKNFSKSKQRNCLLLEDSKT